MKKIFVFMLALTLAFSMAACSEGYSGDVIRIAVAAPMTGSNSEYGIGFSNAAKLMAKSWNEAGGITVGGKVYTVEIVDFDDKSETDEAQMVAERIVSDPGIFGVIGHFSSGVCMSTAPIYQDSQYVNISPTASHADYTGLGDYIFRNNTIIIVETRTGAEIAVKDLGGKAIGILSIDTEWGKSAGDGMEVNIAALGGNFVLRQEVATTQVDFATEVANFRSAGVDVVMVAGMYETLAPFAVAVANAGYNLAGIVGCSNGYTDNLLIVAGAAANGIRVPVSFFAGNTDPAIQAFVNTYEAAYGAKPSALTSHAYDSVGILLEAIKRADSLDREAIKKAMYETKHEGVSGYTVFDEHGEAQKVFTKLMVKDSQFVLAE